MVPVRPSLCETVSFARRSQLTLTYALMLRCRGSGDFAQPGQDDLKRVRLASLALWPAQLTRVLIFPSCLPLSYILPDQTGWYPLDGYNSVQPCPHSTRSFHLLTANPPFHTPDHPHRLGARCRPSPRAHFRQRRQLDCHSLPQGHQCGSARKWRTDGEECERPPLGLAARIRKLITCVRSSLGPHPRQPPLVSPFSAHCCVMADFFDVSSLALVRE